MSNYTINNLTDLGASVVASDYLPVWDASAATTRKTTLTNAFAGIISAANTFTSGQIISPVSTSQSGLEINMPVPGSSTIATRYNGSLRMNLQFTSTLGYFYLYDADLGSGQYGSYVRVGRNSNATQGGAGFVEFMNRAGTAYRVWADSSGNMRVGTSQPTYANDATGTVIGTQTSNIEHKNILGESADWGESLAYIVDAAKHRMAQFEYKSGSYNYSKFDGLILRGNTDERYGMDNNNSLNMPNAIGDLMKSVALLNAKIEELNTRISELESK